MTTSKKIIYVSMYVIAVIMIIGTILSLFNNTENRFLKMLDFPRIQFSIVLTVCFSVMVIIIKKWKWFDYLIVILIGASIVTQSTYFLNYSPFVPKTVPSAEEGDYSDKDKFTILILNVKMKNRKAEPIIKLLKEKDADILITLEADKWWEEKLQSIQDSYKYSQETINEVSYGMTLYSKFPLEDLKVNYLQSAKVPSFETVLTLQSGKKFKLHSVHPAPPKHFEKIPDNEGEKEISIIKIGNKVKDSKMPNLVAGDFNDVAWGETDKLTETKNLLHDVRVGRGLYNSFNADNIFMRWPLDHILVTKEFKVIELERLADVGSDHFPIFAKLVLP